LVEKQFSAAPQNGACVEDRETKQKRLLRHKRLKAKNKNCTNNESYPQNQKSSRKSQEADRQEGCQEEVAPPDFCITAHPGDNTLPRVT
jgi:hypothetical protein